MVTDAVDQTNIGHFGAGLDRAGSALDFEGLDHGDRVAIGEDVADRVADNRALIGRIGLIRRARIPLVGTHRADRESTEFIAVFAAAFGADRGLVSHEPKDIEEPRGAWHCGDPYAQV